MSPSVGAWRVALLSLAITVLSSCGGGGGGGTPPVQTKPTAQGCQGPSNSASNVIGLCVDAGPLASQIEVNRLYTDITICDTGTSNCQTIDHILVDTGSVGLRLLESEVTVGAGGTGFFNCARFLDLSYAWGAVKSLDLRLGQQIINALPVQFFGSSSQDCATGGYSPIETVADLGAKGILGIGLFEQDCGPDCSVGTTGQYYRCQGVCRPATVDVTAQLQNPIARLGSDLNNGFVVKLPAASAPGVSELRGELIFGIETLSNNRLGAANVLLTNEWGQVTTNLAGLSYADSFVDTGSNALFFDFAQTTCFGNGDFYCPPTPWSLTANITGHGGAPTVPVSFSVDNAESLFNQGYPVLPTLAGPIGPQPASAPSETFDWGLPFYFGRSVFHGIAGKSTPAKTHTGPFIGF